MRNCVSSYKLQKEQRGDDFMPKIGSFLLRNIKGII